MIVKFEGNNIPAILERIQNEIINDASRLLDIIGQKVVFESIKRNFKEEGRPERWADLSERTQQERRKQGYPADHPILYRSGELFRNSTTKEGTIYDLNKKELKITCPLKKGERLHFGDLDLPERPFFFLQKEDEKSANYETGKFIAKELQRIVKTEGKTGLEEMLGI